MGCAVEIAGHECHRAGRAVYRGNAQSAARWARTLADASGGGDGAGDRRDCADETVERAAAEGGREMTLLGDVLLNSPWLLPVCAGLAALAMIAVSWLYSSQVAALSRGWKWTLPTLRILALTALCASLLKPVIVRARNIHS